MNSWPVGPNVTGNKKGVWRGSLYQGFALRWVNRRPFGAPTRCHERGTETGYMRPNREAVQYHSPGQAQRRPGLAVGEEL